MLGPDGYAAVQISPPEEAVVLPSAGYPWWQAYQPVSYQLGSRFGTRAQLAAMIQACHTAGVKVYADVVLGWDLHGVFAGGDLASLADFGPSFNANGMVPSDDAVVFVDNQDTERDGSMLDYADGGAYTLANVFMLAWDYGIPEVLSDYTFARFDQGPPSAGGNAIAAVTCGTGGWQCEQRWPAIAGMTGWRNAAAAPRCRTGGATAATRSPSAAERAPSWPSTTNRPRSARRSRPDCPPASTAT